MAMTEQEKCAAGLWYDANNDDELCAKRMRAKELYCELNQLPATKTEERARLFAELFPHVAASAEIHSPVYTDYGSGCYIGEHTFINLGAYLMDGAPITIGSWCFIGPNLGAYTAQHPLLPNERNQGLERALPITIGDNCWLGGDVKIMPGVTIGAGSVIGAGSIVTKDIPAGVVAMGSPCRVVRKITEADSIGDLAEE